MARFDFTFPLGFPAHCFADLDGHAEVDHRGEIEAVYLTDYADRPTVAVEVTGPLADQIKSWLRAKRADEIDEAAADALYGRIASDRENGRAA